MATFNLQWPRAFLADAKNNPGLVIGCIPDTDLPGCPNCGGSGTMYAFYVGKGDKPIYRWIDGKRMTGELVAAPCPVCAGGQQNAWLERICGLSGYDLGIRLDSFIPMKGKEAAFSQAAELLSTAPTPRGFVTFWGSYGVGKTLLLKALVNGFRLVGVTAVYSTMADLLQSIRSEFGDNARGAADALLHQYRRVRVLAIDEVDRVNLTSWAAETMFSLLDGRYSARREMLTVMALNANPRLLPEAYRYLTSRMTEGQIIEVGGDDLRPIVKD